MSRIPTHRVARHPGALLREQIEETGLTVARVAERAGLAAARLATPRSARRVMVFPLVLRGALPELNWIAVKSA